MLKRLKRFWKLSKKDEATIEKLLKLSPELLEKIPEAGDGKAVFIGAGTEDEYKEFLKEEKGLKGIFGL